MSLYEGNIFDSTMDEIIRDQMEQISKLVNQNLMNFASDMLAEKENKQLDKRLKHSKYYRKHYIVEEADLDAVRCRCCGKIFAIDDKWLTYFTKNLDETWCKYYCPYCGKEHYDCI